MGFSGGRIPEIRANRLLLKSASALGIYWSHDRDLALIRRAMDDVLQGFRAGQLRADVGQRYPFQQLVPALADLEGRRSAGKLVLLADAAN